VPSRVGLQRHRKSSLSGQWQLCWSLSPSGGQFCSSHHSLHPPCSPNGFWRPTAPVSCMPRLPHLPSRRGPSFSGCPPPFRSGNDTRWWDSRALFGTFALTGNKAFGNSLVLLGAVLLPWALIGTSRRIKAVASAGCTVIAICVVLSLARSAVLSLVALIVIVA